MLHFKHCKPATLGAIDDLKVTHACLKAKSIFNYLVREAASSINRSTTYKSLPVGVAPLDGSSESTFIHTYMHTL